jgi:hypothetical protein
MLVRVCEKDTRTGPLYSWLLRSFKKELDLSQGGCRVVDDQDWQDLFNFAAVSQYAQHDGEHDEHDMAVAEPRHDAAGPWRRWW